MTYIKILYLLLLLVFTACTQTEEATPSVAYEGVDNSELAPYMNDYGYFGGDTIFGELPIEGTWNFYYEGEVAVGTVLRFSGSIVTLIGNSTLSYGVSKDGSRVRMSSNDYFYIISQKVYKTTSTGSPCYRVIIVDNQNNTKEADACPMSL